MKNPETKLATGQNSFFDIFKGNTSLYNLDALYQKPEFQNLPAQAKKEKAVESFLSKKWKLYKIRLCTKAAWGVFKLVFFTTLIYLALDFISIAHLYKNNLAQLYKMSKLGHIVGAFLDFRLTKWIMAPMGALVNSLSPTIAQWLTDCFAGDVGRGYLVRYCHVFLAHVLPLLLLPLDTFLHTFALWCIGGLFGGSLYVFYVVWLFRKVYAEVVAPIRGMIQVYYYKRYPKDIFEPTEVHYIGEKHTLPLPFRTSVESLFAQIRSSDDMHYVREQLKNIENGVTLYMAVRINYSTMSEGQHERFIDEGKKIFALYPENVQNTFIEAAYALKTNVALRPMMLVGEPGVGKTYFLGLFSKLLGMEVAHPKIESSLPERFLGNETYIGDLQLSVVEAFNKHHQPVGAVVIEEIEKVLDDRNPECQKYLVMLLKLFDSSANASKIDEHGNVMIFLPMFKSWWPLPRAVFSVANFGESYNHVHPAYIDRHNLLLVPSHTYESKLKFIYDKNETGLSKLEDICQQLRTNVNALAASHHEEIKKLIHDDTSKGLRHVQDSIKRYLNRLIMEGKIKRSV